MACNLAHDPTGLADFVGTTGKAVNLTVKGTKGTAKFTGAFYAGAAIPFDPKVSFTIQADDKLLDVVVENTLSGDLTMIVCDDGTVLDRFPFDRNNPAQNYDVKGV